MSADPETRQAKLKLSVRSALPRHHLQSPLNPTPGGRYKDADAERAVHHAKEVRFVWKMDRGHSSSPCPIWSGNGRGQVSGSGSGPRRQSDDNLRKGDGVEDGGRVRLVYQETTIGTFAWRGHNWQAARPCSLEICQIWSRLASKCTSGTRDSG